MAIAVGGFPFATVPDRLSSFRYTPDTEKRMRRGVQLVVDESVASGESPPGAAYGRVYPTRRPSGGEFFRDAEPERHARLSGKTERPRDDDDRRRRCALPGGIERFVH